MDNFETEYIRISKMPMGKIKQEIAKLTPDFRDYYIKQRRKQHNLSYYNNNKEQISMSKKERYNATKKIDKPIIHNMPIIDIKNIDKDIVRDGDKLSIKIKDLSTTSIQTYEATLKTLYNNYNKNYDNSEIYKYLNNIKHNATRLYKENEFILKNIEAIMKETSYIIPQLYKIFSRFNTKKLKEFRTELYPYFIAYTDNYNKNRNNLTIDKEAAALISFNKNDIIQKSQQIENINMKILYLLMFLLPTRRIADYRNTIIINDKQDLDDINNFYFDGKIYINNTKNKQKIILDIPNEINDLISKKTDKYLIGKMSEPIASKKFKDLMRELYGGYIFTAGDIRKLYATYNLKNNDASTIVKNQKRMGHTLSEHLKYVIPN
jgi:hypothetical protein